MDKVERVEEQATRAEDGATAPTGTDTPGPCPCCGSGDAFWNVLNDIVLCPACGLQTKPTHKHIAFSDWRRRPVASIPSGNGGWRPIAEAQAYALVLADSIINRLPANGEHWALMQRYGAAKSAIPGEQAAREEVEKWVRSAPEGQASLPQDARAMRSKERP